MVNLEIDGSSLDLRKKRFDILNGLWQEYRVEEVKWRQKSRLKWLKEGDKNSAFFHSISKKRQYRKNISKLVVEGNTIHEPNQIKAAILNHFKSFFTREDKQRPKIRCNNLARINPMERRSLEAAFTEEEIWNVLKSCDGNKAPGPDGFCSVLGDVLRFFHEFHTSGKLAKGLNAAFISLIPKHHHPQTAADFRPISLIGSAYKLISKVLSARLQVVLPSLISENQFAFTKGRQISDCILIANEVVDLLNKKQGGGFLLKLDFAKAYDNIDWDFLLDLLKEMNFGDKWITWISNCITTASLAILVNDTPTEFFKIEKGLRQGDPLSPLLFNICANGLSCLLNQVLGEELFSGVRIGPELAINHLQFADDTLLFCENNQEQLDILCNIVVSFLFASGLKINLSKSLIIGCNVPKETTRRLVSTYGWSIGKLPILYLGAPLGGNPRRTSFWGGMLDKLRNKARSWNSKYISLSGRLTLMKYALCAIPLYLMGNFKAPIGVIGEAEKILRAFLWGKDEGGRKIAWIPWALICQSKESGGLGVGFLTWKNRALLLKWAWRYGIERQSLWRKVITEKYGLDSRSMMLHSAMIEGRNWSPQLLDIINLLMEDSILAKGLTEGLFCGVGDGKNTSFWADPWADFEPLNTKFPRIFALCENKTAMVADMGLFVQGKWIWDVPFRRQFFNWEVEIFQSFNSVINSCFPSVDSPDILFWRFDNSGSFSVKSLCLWAEKKTFGDDVRPIPTQIRRSLPPKVGLLFWQVNLNKVATKDNLLKRGISLPDNGLCSLCQTTLESGTHLFLHCPKTWILWCFVLAREGVQWAIPSSLDELSSQWEFLAAGSDPLLWNLIPYSIVWTIWLGRNDLLFQGRDFSPLKLWEMLNLRIGWWVKSIWKRCPYDAQQFAENFCHIRVERNTPRPRNMRWVPPSAGILKYNVDGASQGNPGRCGIGGVLRNSDRKILGFFSINLGHGGAAEAELKAIWKALIFCNQFHFRDLIIESDSTVAVGWVNSHRNRPWKWVNILNEIDYLMKVVSCLEVKHNFRETNGIADFLAKKGCTRTDTIWAQIAIGSAKGLAYLHEDCHPRIIHQEDIKGANILIENNFDAKVADFGLAKFNQDTNTCFYSYLAPEYASSGKLTEKYDVFSFGIMLLELITGRRPVDNTELICHSPCVDKIQGLNITGYLAALLHNLHSTKLEASKHGLQLFEPKYPSFFTNHEETETSCAFWQVVADALLGAVADA
ncbi:uncharacterized protein LOC130719736 [Lotus japonicus]|uniref:uncharacterized protein LOC130719736 n=1 Tax=Lotus japonicus TaxID=34305 RepID=UPI0025876349|nr:uncharacterized protein LOC130719736 [Lotus japonicus]